MKAFFRYSFTSYQMTHQLLLMYFSLSSTNFHFIQEYLVLIKFRCSIFLFHLCLLQFLSDLQCRFQHLICFEKVDKNVFKAKNVVCREFLAFKYSLFQNKSNDYLYLYIRNLKNSRLKPGFWYKISNLICVGRQRNLYIYCVVEKQVLKVHI